MGEAGRDGDADWEGKWAKRFVTEPVPCDALWRCAVRQVRWYSRSPRSSCRTPNYQLRFLQTQLPAVAGEDPLVRVYLVRAALHRGVVVR